MTEEKKKKGFFAAIKESMNKSGGCCGGGETCGCGPGGDHPVDRCNIRTRERVRTTDSMNSQRQK